MNHKTILKLWYFFLFIYFVIILYLLKQTFFFHDEWTFLFKIITSPSEFITTPHNGHFWPIFASIYIILYKLFRLNYLPYQFVLLIFHFGNVLIIKKIIEKITNSQLFGILAGTFFLFSNIYWEVIFSFSTFPTVLCLFFITLAVWLYLKYEDKNKTKYIYLSGISTLFSGLVWGAGVFSPILIAIVPLIKSWRTKKLLIRPLTNYLIFQIISMAVYFHFSNNSVGNTVEFNKIITFSISAIWWNIVNFYTGSPGFIKLLALVFIILGLLASSIIFNNRNRDRLFKQLFFNIEWYLFTIISFAFYIVITAYSRYQIDMRLSSSSRYTYFPLFFLVILNFILFKTFSDNIKRKLNIVLVTYYILLIGVNIYFFKIFYIKWTDSISLPNKAKFEEIITAKSIIELEKITFPTTFHSFYTSKEIYFIYRNTYPEKNLPKIDLR